MDSGQYQVIIDSIDSGLPRVELSPEQRAVMRRCIAKAMPHMKTAAHNMFLIESSINGYQPAPPEGFIGLRSSSRRVFMRRDPIETLGARLAAGEYLEVPFSS